MKLPPAQLKSPFDSEGATELVSQYSQFLRQLSELQWQLCFMARLAGDILAKPERERERANPNDASLGIVIIFFPTPWNFDCSMCHTVEMTLITAGLSFCRGYAMV